MVNRGVKIVVVLLVLAALISGTSGTNAADSPSWFDVHSHLAQMVQQARGAAGEHGASRMRDLSLVGQSRPANADKDELSLVGQLGPADDPVFDFPNADVWAFKDFAYVGTWGFPGLCPGTGVKVVDISDPDSPELVTTIPSHADTQANDVKVAEIDTDGFDGVLLAHSDAPCGPDGIMGFHLLDVTDPEDPVPLSRFPTGRVHNLYLFEREDRAFVLLAEPFAEVFGGLFGVPESDFQIVEVTDPKAPVPVGEWTIGRDAGLAFGSPIFADDIPPFPEGSDCAPPPGTPDLCRGDHLPGVFLHDVWANEEGTVAYLSYWDAGLILLDISNPTNPTLIGRGVEPSTFGSDEGNAHAAVPADDGDLVLVTDEDLTEGPWGFLRIFETSDPSNPTEIGAFATGNALTGSEGFPGDVFSAHNLLVQDDLAFLSWYTDGIRVVDFSEPSAPQEIASFVVRGVPSRFWGVFVDSEDSELVFGSDIFNGLYILEFEPGE